MEKTTARDFDFERTEPSYWALNAWWMAPLAVFTLTVTLTVLSFPTAWAWKFSSRTWQFSYVFASPLVFWALTRPRFKVFALVALGAQVVSWTLILCWLRHVTWGGLFLLGPFVGAWIGVWYLAAWWAARHYPGRPFLVRMAILLGLAGLWVVIEWTRTWFLGGFPWLPLAGSHWKIPLVLQIASYTGQGGVAFVLMVFNFAFAAYAHRLFKEKGLRGFRRRSPEFSVALVLLACSIALWVLEVSDKKFQPWVRVAFVQPDIPQSPVETEETFREKLALSREALEKHSRDAARLTAPELILWPESALPYALHGWRQSDWARACVTAVAADTKTPLLIGAIMTKAGEKPGDMYYNAAIVVEPGKDIAREKFYAKRHLVPFGEYVPLRPLLGWLEKVSAVGSSDAQPGGSASPLSVTTPRAQLNAGMLICYEDIFPELAVSNVYAGADAHAVLTDTAWFGKSGAAHQHAAHSVLRAVETRRPVLRCGNSGWSGWIDEYGNTRALMTNREGSTSFRGTQTFDIERDANWAGRDSFYVRHGDWFVALCAALVFFGYMMARFYSPRDKTPPVFAETVTEQ